MKQIYDYQLLPIPWFIIDSHMTIIDASTEGQKLMKDTSFRNILDHDSLLKFGKYFHSTTEGRLELNINGMEKNLPTLVDLHFYKENQSAYIVLISKSGHYQEMNQNLLELQEKIFPKPRILQNVLTLDQQMSKLKETLALLPSNDEHEGLKQQIELIEKTVKILLH
ncbi:hypothetical protein Q73_00995 [Bacillus coahuilensis m2-6]|uniref:hypothetical protein n=1 Tax=Bacillus coahuilensis TaxID=408580 RepID=UPI0001850AA4|nr:hypothetical protein [Bacillus coahuilensis]KUP09845.1 hypothetical protein Q73_00995 [Bacillus coahuilensis m2-6]